MGTSPIDIPPPASAWRATNGEQKPLDILDQAAQDGLWAEALERGTAIEAWLDDHIDAGVSSLGGTRQPFDFHYDACVAAPHYDIETACSELANSIRRAGTGIREDFSNFNLLYVNSKIHPDEADNVNIIDLLTLSANPELGVLVTEDYHPEAEINSAENRLTLSELIWGAYQETAVDWGESARLLKVWQQAFITDQETINIMQLAHQRFPALVDATYPGGYAKWLPATNPTTPPTSPSQIYTRLLSTPILKSVVALLAEQNIALANPYPIELHTFPGPGIIVIVLGRVPHTLDVPDRDPRAGPRAGNYFTGAAGPSTAVEEEGEVSVA